MRSFCKGDIFKIFKPTHLHSKGDRIKSTHIHTHLDCGTTTPVSPYCGPSVVVSIRVDDRVNVPVESFTEFVDLSVNAIVSYQLQPSNSRWLLAKVVYCISCTEN